MTRLALYQDYPDHTQVEGRLVRMRIEAGKQNSGS